MKLVKTTENLPNKAGRIEQQELWITMPQSSCKRDTDDQWVYKLSNKGIINFF